MSDETTPGSDLADRIDSALRDWLNGMFDMGEYVETFEPSRGVEAVMDVVQPEIDRRDAEIKELQEAAAIAHDIATDRRCLAREAAHRAEQAGAAIARVKALAEDMRTWRSPHGIAVMYAQRIDEAIEPPEHNHDALLIGSDSEAEFAAKLGAIMREHRDEVHLEHHEGCGNCAVIKGAPEILTAGLYRNDLPAVRAFAAKLDPREEPPCPTT